MTDDLFDIIGLEIFRRRRGRCGRDDAPCLPGLDCDEEFSGDDCLWRDDFLPGTRRRHGDGEG